MSCEMGGNQGQKVQLEGMKFIYNPKQFNSYGQKLKIVQKNRIKDDKYFMYSVNIAKDKNK